jgi:hypothetical protein
MPPSTISQPINNAVLPAQSGDGFVVKAPVELSGGDVLIGVSASAWSQAPGQISMQVWLDDQPADGNLSIYANEGQMHMSLGHTWVLCESVPAGQHTIALEAGPTTVTDENDRACVTVWQIGDDVAARFSVDAPCPQGTGQTLFKELVETEGGPLLISACASGWVTQAATCITGFTPVDGGDPARLEVFANNANQHMSMVATDYVYSAANRGLHEVLFNADGLTSTDGGDTAHLAIVEWLGDGTSPRRLPMQNQLQNATAQTQTGEGGTVAASQFQAGGGTLLIRTNVSAWTTNPGLPLMIGIQIDGTSVGFTEIFANPAETHMAMVSNDLVVTGVTPGSHELTLIGEANTYTDYNDRVSVMILEFDATM